jgi:hypothetical protein
MIVNNSLFFNNTLKNNFQNYNNTSFETKTENKITIMINLIWIVLLAI